MTQQLDLALNMTTTTDKMMSNSTLSYSNKDSKELNTQFGSFLDNANKTYTKTNDNKHENNSNNISYKHNEKSDAKTTKNEQSNVKSDNKSVKKSDIQENKSDSNITYDKSVNEQTDVKTVATEEFVQAETVEEIENMDEILEESILTANISDVVKMVSPEAINKIETNMMFSKDVDMELPAEAINSGIQFDANLVDVDIQGADLNVIDSITKDMSVSKEDVIASIYDQNLKTTDEKQQVTGLEKVSEKIEDVKDFVDKAEVKDIKEDVENLANIKTKEDVSAKTGVISDAKVDVNVEVDNVEKLAVDKNEVKDIKNEDTKVIVKDINTNKEIVVEDNTADKQIENVQDVQQVKDTDTVQVKDTKTVESEKEIQVEDIQNLKNLDAIQNEYTQQLQDTEVKQQDVTVELTSSIAIEIKPEAKVEQLKQEISSAKLENTANNVQTQIDKKLTDENAKTNVDADETMDIKDDVSGIEFVNNNKNTAETDNDTKLADTHAEKIKQRVENVKIQVEEDVKVNPQLMKNAEDVNNMVKAQETLNKAGLTTENLQQMDAKIKDIEYSQNNAQSDLGQSSQEMLMRDILQNSAQNSSSEAVELKVDFNQSLNKVLQASSTQQNVQTQDELQDVNILDQIRAKFALNSQNGMQKITIGLTPESLGKLHIEISRGMNGLSAQIVAENPQAKEILDKNLDSLRSVLQSQGVNVNNVNVKIAEAGRSSDSNNNLFNSEDGQFNSNNNGNHSKHSSEGENEKRTEYEHLQNEAMRSESVENADELAERDNQSGKTVSIKGSTGNVKYQL